MDNNDAELWLKQAPINCSNYPTNAPLSIPHQNHHHHYHHDSPNNIQHAPVQFPTPSNEMMESEATATLFLPRST
jgi:hypothetical protein